MVIFTKRLIGALLQKAGSNAFFVQVKGQRSWIFNEE
jgi:hypothetical protein